MDCDDFIIAKCTTCGETCNSTATPDSLTLPPEWTVRLFGEQPRRVVHLFCPKPECLAAVTGCEIDKAIADTEIAVLRAVVSSLNLLDDKEKLRRVLDYVGRRFQWKPTPLSTEVCRSNENQVQILAENLVSCRVCTRLNDENTIQRMNLLHPAGTSNGWSLSEQPALVCSDDPSRRHLVLLA